MTSALLMPLLNEGADVWRSVVAEPLEDGTYQILGPMPDDEEWTFAPGSIVASQLRTFGNGEEQLVAMPLADRALDAPFSNGLSTACPASASPPRK